MQHGFDPEERDPGLGYVKLPTYDTKWDRDLNVYNIQELPVLPADGDPGCKDLPVGLIVLRELCLDAATAYSWEVWFDFASKKDEGFLDICWTPPSKGTQAVRLPSALLMQGDSDLGVFGPLLEMSAEDGMFAIHVNEFRDAPKKHNPFDKRGRLVPPPPEPEPEEETPGLVEMATIRAFRLSLKGHTAPDDLVIQICQRFWHMPTGFEVG